MVGALKQTLQSLFSGSKEMSEMRRKIESSFHCEKVEASKEYQPFGTQVRFQMRNTEANDQVDYFTAN